LRRYGEIRVVIGAKIREIWSFLEARSKTILHTRKPMGSIYFNNGEGLHAITNDN
jgi:hypothetical protein